MSAAHLFTQHRTIVKAAANDGDFSVRAVLTLPIADLAGDIVRPDGLDFAAHRADPWVDLEHGFEPSVGRQPVGWARKSLALSGGTYSVEHALLEVPGAVFDVVRAKNGKTTEVVGKCKLPVGTTYFDRDHALQRQVYFMVKKGALPGVSLEFCPDYTVAKALGPSPLERRDAFDFPRASVVRWTHCVEPVCPGALTVLKSLPPELDALARCLRDGKVEGEALHPVIVKSLARYKPTVTLSVGKAMPDATDSPATVYDEAAPDATADAGDEKPAKPTAAAHYNFAQGMTALIEQAREDLEMSEHVKGRKHLLAKLDKLEADVEAIKGMGDKIDAETGDEPETEEGEEESEPPDMDTDDEGTFKAVRGPYRVILKAVRGVRRYSLAEVQKGIADAADADRPESMAEALARIQKEDPDEYARLEAKARRVRRLAATG